MMDNELLETEASPSDGGRMKSVAVGEDACI